MRNCLLAASIASSARAPMPVRIAAVQRGVTCVTMSFVTVQLRPQATMTKAKRKSATDFVDRDFMTSRILGAIEILSPPHLCRRGGSSGRWYERAPIEGELAAFVF